MTEHEDLIARLRAVVETALSDAGAASSEFDCSAEDFAATEAHCRELEAVRDELIDILNAAPCVALDRVKAEAVREAADAFEGGTINVEIFEDSAEARRWEASNAARERIVASMRARADRIEKGESNE